MPMPHEKEELVLGERFVAAVFLPGGEFPMAAAVAAALVVVVVVDRVVRLVHATTTTRTTRIAGVPWLPSAW